MSEQGGPRPSPQPPLGSRSEPARILVVDDDDAKRYVITRMLRAAGYRIDEAANGTDTLARVRQEHPDLVVLDVKLPDIDGMEVARLLKAEDATRGTLVLQLSAAFRDPISRSMGLDAGADAYLAHPVDNDELLATVRALLRISQTERALREANDRANEALRQAREADARLREILKAAREREEQAEKWAEFQQYMLGVVGHDLRNPLTAIITTASTQLRRQEDEQLRRAFSRVLQSGNRATRIVSGLLDYTRARLGSGIPVERKEIDLAKLLRSIADEAIAAAPNRPIALDVPAELVGQWDGDRLDQVFMNLLTNALQYGPPGEPVSMSAETNGRLATVRVHNGGAPIPPELQPRIFEPYRRGTDEGRGLGLGLYIVKQIVAAHGGTVEVRSEKGTGTTFTVTLPMQAK